MGFPGGSDGKESDCNAGDLGSIPGLGRSPGEGNGSPLQYSCLENPMDRGPWLGYSPWGHKESYFTFTLRLLYLILTNGLLKCNKHTQNTYIIAYSLMHFHNTQIKRRASPASCASVPPSLHEAPPQTLLRAEAVLCLVWLPSLPLCLRELSTLCIVRDHFHCYIIFHSIFIHSTVSRTSNLLFCICFYITFL